MPETQGQIYRRICHALKGVIRRMAMRQSPCSQIPESRIKKQMPLRASVKNAGEDAAKEGMNTAATSLQQWLFADHLYERRW